MKPEKCRVAEFLGHFPIDSLNDTYVDGNVDDGNQKLIVFKMGMNEKRVRISNVYQEDVANLFGVLNGLLPSDQEIKYTGNE